MLFSQTERNLLSCCSSLSRIQDLLPAGLLRTYKSHPVPLPEVKLFLCKESFSPSSAYFRSWKAKRLSHAGGTLLQSIATVLQSQKTSPTAPLSPPTYPHTLPVPHTHIHSQLGSKNSSQWGQPENSRKHQKQLQKLFMSECERVICSVYMCSALLSRERKPKGSELAVSTQHMLPRPKSQEVIIVTNWKRKRHIFFHRRRDENKNFLFAPTKEHDHICVWLHIWK